MTMTSKLNAKRASRGKGFKTPLILLLVLLALAGIAYWDEGQTSTDKKLTEDKSKLYDFKVEDITEISATNVHVVPAQWTLKKTDGVWRVASPMVYAADSNGIDRFLKILADAKYERQFEVGAQGLEGYGLAKPQFAYRLTDKTGKTWDFELGAKSPTGYSSYLKKGDSQQVYLVNQYLSTATNKTLTDFRDRSLAIPSAKSVTMLEVQWPRMPGLKLTRGATEKDWNLVTPVATAADATEVSKYLSAWEQLRVIDFIDSPAPALKTALTDLSKGTKEYVKAHFTADQGGAKDVVILENNGKLYTSLAADTFAEIDKHQVDELRKTVTDLQDRTIFSFVSADVHELSIDGKLYSKSGENWIEASNKRPAPSAQGIVVSLEFAKADALLPPGEGESLTHEPAFHVVELKEKGKAPTQFSLWKKATDPNTLILKNGARYFAVNAEFLDIIKPRSEPRPGVIGGEMRDDKPE